MIQKVHLLFEQSGTFKKEFQSLGIDAEDYDILNDFGQTDHVVDLFSEIRGGGYQNKPSLFDNISQNDLIIAFFPCVRFEASILLSFRGQAKQMKNWTDKQKMEYCMKLQRELSDLYELINMLFIICIDRGFRLIVENPYSEEHFLRRYWCLKPSVIDKDRTLRGDYYRKPTQYWFVNMSPSNNIILEAIPDNSLKRKDAVRTISSGSFEKETGIKTKKQAARSMIHPEYANRFIREFIL